MFTKCANWKEFWFLVKNFNEKWIYTKNELLLFVDLFWPDEGEFVTEVDTPNGPMVWEELFIRRSVFTCENQVWRVTVCSRTSHKRYLFIHECRLYRKVLQRSQDESERAEYVSPGLLSSGRDLDKGRKESLNVEDERPFKVLLYLTETRTTFNWGNDSRIRKNKYIESKVFC